MDNYTIYIVSILLVAITSIVCVVLWWIVSKDRRITKDIIENIQDSVIIFDEQDKPSYINIVPFYYRNAEMLESISREIVQSGVLPKDYKNLCINSNDAKVYEGILKPYEDYDIIYYWKMKPIVRNKKYNGCLYVFNDITQYMKLHKQLDEQNEQLRVAYENQKKYIEIAKKLSAEERERIMKMVDSISSQYREKLDISIQRMEQYADSSDANDLKAYDEENEKMIKITRETIENVRSTVKELHNAV